MIKMIIKGRSPTMRHVSRTHRVAPDWPCDRINLDPQVICRHQKTKLADILTNGNIMNISRFSCGDVSPINGLQAMSKRLIQKGKQGGKDERMVAKSRYRVSKTLNRSPTAPSTSPSQSLGNLAANCSTLDSLSTGKLVSMDSQKNNERIRHSSVADRH